MTPELDTIGEEDFARLVTAHAPRLLRLAWRLAPQGVDPDDLVQDTFERAWRHRGRFRRDAAPATWLHAILVNRVHDLHRRACRSDVDTEQNDLDQLIDLQVSDPAELVARAETEQELRGALSRLGTSERTAVALHDGEGWSASEIATLTDCSTEAAHKRIQRGRFRLLEALHHGDVPAHEAPPLSCRAARRATSDYLDGHLDSADRSGVEAHLRDCVHCPPVVQALSGVRSAMAANLHADPSAVLLARLKRSVRIATHQSVAAGAAEEASTTTER